MALERTFSGLLLTKQQFDRDGKLVLVFWLKAKEGPVRVEVEKEHVVVFCLAEDANWFASTLTREGIRFQQKPLALKHFNQSKVVGFYFTNLKAFFAAKACANESGLVLYEQDIKHCDRYLMERFIQGQAWAKGRYQFKNGVHCLYQAKLAKSDETSLLSSELTCLSLDIECSGLGVLYSIGFYNATFQKVVMIGKGQPLHWLEWVNDETALLKRFVEIIEELDPDIMIGWNVIDFDFSVLFKRAEELGLKLPIGRFSSQLRLSQSKVNKLILPGRIVLDGIDMLKNASYHFSSFRLGQVSYELLGEEKLIQGGDTLAEIERQFKYEKEALAKYNLQDCKLVWDIFENKSLIDFAIARAKLTGLDLHRLGGSVAAFTNLYLPHLHRAGYIAPNLGESPVHFESPGGYVMDSIPGLYQNVLVLDYKSLYPSIIRSFKIDPLGLVEGLKQDNAIEGFNGAKFSRTEHFIPELILQLWQAREVAKKEHDETMSYAIKIIMNSFYGVLGSYGCRFFDPRLSSSITMRGHEIMKTTKQLIEEKGFQVIYGDTDSTFVAIDGNNSQRQCDDIGRELAQSINTYWRKVLSEKGLESALELEFETHYKPFFMPTLRGETTGSKKRYAGINQTGKLIFKGLEAARGDWTVLAKEFQTELYQKLFTNQAVEEYITTQVKLLKSGELDDKLVYRKRLGQDLEMYRRNIPPHVRAVLDYQVVHPDFFIKRGDWVSYVITLDGPLYLPEQHITHLNKIDYQHYLDKQLKPIVEAIEKELQLSFEQLVNEQQSLF
ncbi:DNA polymerase II [Pseudoalteromonas piratica]|uniref:DNA polymerase n=1 Tax=Pseudoalteromonas piratica TaxID=1348114 RepID=A0A0A7EIJ6_9GAMM|nr:DNA polymerase II [Pseudoalteromonas piratica]AIY65886.1 DNA polymerase II [Pseudoalteromonas piratica]